MGIRESLERQREEEGAGNIKEYVINEGPKEDIEFDFEKELDDRWEALVRTLELCGRSSKWGIFLTIADSLRILDASRLQEVEWNDVDLKMANLQEEKADESHLARLVEEIKRRTGWIREFLREVAAFKDFYPNYFQKKEDELFNIETRDRRINMREDIKRYIGGLLALGSKLECVALCKRIFLDKSPIANFKIREFELDDNELVRLVERETVSDTLEIAALIRILDPKRFDRLRLRNILQRQIKEKMAELKQSSAWFDSLRRFPLYLDAVNLKIIFAQDVKITDQGLELITPEKKSAGQQIPKRPERRAF